MGKSKASFLNLLSALCYQCVAATGSFIIPGMLLSNYGASLHGYISTVNNFMVYVSLATMGLAPAAIQAYYKPLAENDSVGISCVYNTVAKLYNKAAIYYLFGMIFITLIIFRSVHGQLSDQYIIFILWAIGINGIIECLLYSRCRVFLLADQRLYYVNFVDAIMYAVRVGIQLILINLSLSIVLIVLIPTILTPIRALVLKRIIDKKYNINRRIQININLLSKRYNAFVHQISSMIVLNTDVVLLTLFGNLIMTSIYAVYNLVFSSIYSILTNMFKNGLVAVFGNMIFEDETNKKMVIVYDQYEFIYYIVVTIIYGCCGTLILPFVKLYTQGQIITYENTMISVLFMIIGVANNVRVPADTLITAAGHFKETQWRAVAEAIINLIVSLLLIKPLGIVGIHLGTIISFLYRSADIIIYTYRHILQKNVFGCVLRIIRMVVVIFVCVMSNKLVLYKYDIRNWSDWLGAGIIVFIQCCFWAVFVNYIFESKLIRKIIRKYILSFRRM